MIKRIRSLAINPTTVMPHISRESR